LNKLQISIRYGPIYYIRIELEKIANMNNLLISVCYRKVWHRTGWYRDNALDMYSGDAWFEFGRNTGYLERVFMAFLSLQATAGIVPLPSKSSSVHQANIRLSSLDTLPSATKKAFSVFLLYPTILGARFTRIASKYTRQMLYVNESYIRNVTERCVFCSYSKIRLYCFAPLCRPSTLAQAVTR
jgi:hypothetical protein